MILLKVSFDAGMGYAQALAAPLVEATQAAISFAESAAKMGIAFDITADQAGDMMAKWRTD